MEYWSNGRLECWSLGGLEYWFLKALLQHSIVPPFRFPPKETPPPMAEGLLGGKIQRLLRCDSGEHVVLSALDEQKDIVLVFGLL